MKKNSIMRFPFFSILILATLCKVNAQTPMSDAPQSLEDSGFETSTAETNLPETNLPETNTTDASSSDSTNLDFGDQTLPAETSSAENSPTNLPESSPNPANSSTIEETKQAEFEKELTQETTTPKKSENPKTRKQEGTVSEKKVRTTDVFIQEKSTYKLDESYKSISLNGVIEQGLRLNSDQEIRNLKLELNDLNITSNFRSFWLPNLKLTLVTAEQRVGTLSSSSRSGSERPSERASGSFGFDIGSYTLFNWGKDYALYLNNKQNFDRQKKLGEEEKRDLKLDLITDYLELIKKKNILKVRQDQLRRASFIYRLNKEKVTVGKTSQQDYYLSRAIYLKAQSDYQEAKIEADRADENLAYLIKEKAGTKFIVNEVIDYQKMKITLANVLEILNDKNSSILDSKTRIDLAERELDIARKENLPLPKFTLNLGGYRHKFGTGISKTNYETYEDSGNIDVVASINATWDLFGSDGFLNADKLKRKRIELELSRHELRKSKSFSEAQAQNIYKNLITLQNQLLILEARIPTAQKSYDTILENYLDGKTRFNDYKLALDDYIETKIMYETFLAEHAQQKLQLAKVIGVEDFPGENFEKIVTREKGK